MSVFRCDGQCISNGQPSCPKFIEVEEEIFDEEGNVTGTEKVWVCDLETSMDDF